MASIGNFTYPERFSIELYHRSMDRIIQDINEQCSKDIYLCFADNKVRLSRAFYHVLVMDGAIFAAASHVSGSSIPSVGKGKEVAVFRGPILCN